MIALVDTHYLCHRAAHSTGDLHFNGIDTGVVYGVLREVATVHQRYKPRSIVFAFDSRDSHRRDIYPAYKANRVCRSDEEAEQGRQLAKAIVELRTKWLPLLGYMNCFAAKGYEADDIIAKLAAEMHFDEEAVIVAADHDYFQCLTGKVWMYNPAQKEEYTTEDFHKEWELHPESWARIKAIAGCSSDNIKGVKGVGEKTAAKWVRGELKKDSPVCERIERRLGKAMQINYPLVKLPFDNRLPDFDIAPDETTQRLWRKLAKQLGMKSLVERLIDNIPIPAG